MQRGAMDIRTLIAVLGALAGPFGTSVQARDNSPLYMPHQVQRISLAMGSQKLTLPSRDRSGAAIPNVPPVTAVVEAAEDELRLTIRFPSRERGGTDQPTVAVMLWNAGPPPYAPASVLSAARDRMHVPSLGGRIFLSVSEGAPRFVGSTGVWERLGVRLDMTAEEWSVRIPLTTIADLCPDGVLFDVRVQSGGKLYSYGPSASWFDPPEPARAVAIDRLQSIDRVKRPSAAMRALVGELKAVPVVRGPQLWALSHNPLPLGQHYCALCAELAGAIRTRERDGPAFPADVIERLALRAAPTDLAWQESMLEVQSVRLETGDFDGSLDVGFRILEADGISAGTALRAVRALAAGLLRARISLRDTNARSADVKSRLINAVSDRNFRAAYGADLLIMHEGVGAATALLESVRSNGNAASAARAHAVFRLEQLAVFAGDWPRALDLAREVEAEAPYDVVLRGASLTALSRHSDEIHAAGIDVAAISELRERLKLTSDTICRRYFAAMPISECPVCISEEE